MIENAVKIEFETVANVDDSLLKFAVIVCRYQGRWIYCQHKERDTWEIPGGRREQGEAILDTARRELYEETGALEFVLEPVCAYYVRREEKSYGLLCYAEVKELGELPVSEIERIQLSDDLPDAWTYPFIQPFLLARVKLWLRG